MSKLPIKSNFIVVCGSWGRQEVGRRMEENESAV
jgi:hypothetical protein